MCGKGNMQKLHELELHWAKHFLELICALATCDPVEFPEMQEEEEGRSGGWWRGTSV